MEGMCAIKNVNKTCKESVRMIAANQATKRANKSQESRHIRKHQTNQETKLNEKVNNQEN